MNVLIAVDDKEFADCIADFVTSQEWPPHTNFVVLHVIEPLQPIITTLPAPVAQMIAEDRKKYGEQVVRSVVMKIVDAFKTEHITEAVVEGHPKEKIMEWSQKTDADMIVVGAHNKSLIDRLMLGSVSLAIGSRAQCSVAIVRPKIKTEANATSTTASERALATK
jgi:nucleotide-binding universal stress UspA family protein